MRESAYDRWKTTTPEDGPELPTEEEKDYEEYWIELETERKLEERHEEKQ